MDGPAPSCKRWCDQPVGSHAPSWYPVVAGFQRWSNFCPKASPIITFAASSAKECHDLITFSVKVLFPLFLLNTQVLNNLRSLPDLPLLSYLVFSVSSHALLFLTHLDLFFGTYCLGSVPIRAPLPTLAELHWLVPAKQLSCDLCSHGRCSALSVSMQLYQGALRFRLVPNSCSLMFPECSGCLQAEETLNFWDEPTQRTNNADSHQTFTERVHKLYVCFTALRLQWSLFPYFRKSLNLAGKTWWTSPEGLSLPG